MWHVERLDQRRPELRLQRADAHPAVRAAVHAVAGMAAVEVQRARAGHLAVVEEAAGVHRQPADDAVEHADVAVLSLAGALAVVQRGEDGDGRAHGAAAEVADLHAGHGDVAIDRSGDAQRAADGHVVEVMSGTITIWPILAITADAAEDDGGVDRAQRLVADAEPVDDAGTE